MREGERQRWTRAATAEMGQTGEICKHREREGKGTTTTLRKSRLSEKTALNYTNQKGCESPTVRSIPKEFQPLVIYFSTFKASVVISCVMH